MHRYILKRLLMLIPVIIGITFIIFFILNLAPGDPVAMILGSEATEENVAALREELGLNDPLLVQYGRYMLNLVRGNMGNSYVTGRDVFGSIIERFPVTLTMAVCAILVSVIIAIPVGIISATRQYSFMDTSTMVMCLLGVSMPNFWLGLMLILLFSVQLSWLPSGGLEGFVSFILPALTMGINSAASIARLMRSSMLEVIRQDYIRTARAKGVRQGKVIIRHALKNALMPVITIVGVHFGRHLGGAVVVEVIFSLPGTGRLMLDAIRGRDIPVVMGCIVFISIIFSFINLLVDIVYGFIDPRLRSEYK